MRPKFKKYSRTITERDPFVGLGRILQNSGASMNSRLGRITSVEKSSMQSDPATRVCTGYIQVEYIETTGTVRALYMHPMSGQGSFFGGMPSNGDIVMVFPRPGSVALAIGATLLDNTPFSDPDITTNPNVVKYGLQEGEFFGKSKGGAELYGDTNGNLSLEDGTGKQKVTLSSDKLKTLIEGISLMLKADQGIKLDSGPITRRNLITGKFDPVKFQGNVAYTTKFRFRPYLDNDVLGVYTQDLLFEVGDILDETSIVYVRKIGFTGTRLLDDNNNPVLAQLSYSPGGLPTPFISVTVSEAGNVFVKGLGNINIFSLSLFKQIDLTLTDFLITAINAITFVAKTFSLTAAESASITTSQFTVEGAQADINSLQVNMPGKINTGPITATLISSATITAIVTYINTVVSAAIAGHIHPVTVDINSHAGIAAPSGSVLTSLVLPTG